MVLMKCFANISLFERDRYLCCKVTQFIGNNDFCRDKFYHLHQNPTLWSLYVTSMLCNIILNISFKLLYISALNCFISLFRRDWYLCDTVEHDTMNKTMAIQRGEPIMRKTSFFLELICNYLNFNTHGIWAGFEELPVSFNKCRLSLQKSTGSWCAIWSAETPIRLPFMIWEKPVLRCSPRWHRW